MSEAPPPDPAGATTSPPTTGAPAGRGRRGRLGRWWWVAGIAIAAAVVVVLVPLASPDPDGLESVAGQQGWLGTALDPVFRLIPDYTVPGIDGNPSRIVAGLIGMGIVLALVLGLGWLMRRRRSA